MGEIIRLRPRQGAKPEQNVPELAGTPVRDGATILLFTGVRYQRHEELEPTPPRRHSPRGGGRKRA